MPRAAQAAPTNVQGRRKPPHTLSPRRREPSRKMSRAARAVPQRCPGRRGPSPPVPLPAARPGCPQARSARTTLAQDRPAVPAARCGLPRAPGPMPPARALSPGLPAPPARAGLWSRHRGPGVPAPAGRPAGNVWVWHPPARGRQGGTGPGGHAGAGREKTALAPHDPPSPGRDIAPDGQPESSRRVPSRCRPGLPRDPRPPQGHHVASRAAPRDRHLPQGSHEPQQPQWVCSLLAGPGDQGPAGP